MGSMLYEVLAASGGFVNGVEVAIGSRVALTEAEARYEVDAGNVAATGQAPVQPIIPEVLGTDVLTAARDHLGRNVPVASLEQFLVRLAGPIALFLAARQVETSAAAATAGAGAAQDVLDGFASLASGVEADADAAAASAALAQSFAQAASTAFGNSLHIDAPQGADADKRAIGRANLGLGAAATLSIADMVAAVRNTLAIVLADIGDASANGRSLLGATDFAAMRSLLSLVVGTHVQAWDVDLDAIASLATMTFGRSLLTLASAQSARAALGIDKYTPVGDAAYPIQATDRTIGLTAALTAPRTWSLPAASSINAGGSLRVVDMVGGVSAANKLTIAALGSDTVNGAASAAFAAPFTDFQLVSDGASRWTYDVQGLARGGTGATNAADARTNLGLGSAALLAAGAVGGAATLDVSTGKLLAAQIPDALLGAVRYQGGWNAATNSPALPTPAVANKGYYYIVTVAGASSQPGPAGAITDWQVGDWAVSDGVYWEKVDSSDQVISVAGLQGAITAAALKAALAIGVADIIDASANGRSLVSAANYAAMRNLLGLVVGTNVQAWDADLDALAALATQSFGRSLLTLSDASAARTSLGLVVGTDVQAYDADLAAIAALSTQAFGRSLLTASDVTAARGALGFNSSGATAFRNRILNGTFTVNQRGVSGTVTLAAGQVGHDRWKAGSGGCTYTFGTASGITTLTITSGSLLQVVEGGLYIRDGGAFVLSWAGTSYARVYQGSAPSFTTTSPLLVSGQAAATDTIVEFSSGTLTLVQLEGGTIVTPFEHRDDEAIRCQRYVEPFGNGIAGMFQDANTFVAAVTWARTKRVAPSFVFRGSLTVLDVMGQGQLTAAAPSSSFFNGSVSGGRMNITGFSGATAGRFGIIDQSGTPPILALADL